MVHLALSVLVVHKAAQVPHQVHRVTVALLVQSAHVVPKVVQV